MFDLKKFTALAMAGTFAFGVAASTTYAAEAPHKELPKAEQPAPQPSRQQDKQAKQKNDKSHPKANHEAAPLPEHK